MRLQTDLATEGCKLGGFPIALNLAVDTMMGRIQGAYTPQQFFDPLLSLCISSTTSSRDQHRRQVPTTPKSEPNFNPPADYHKHRSTQRYVNAVGHPQDYPDTEPRITSHRLESIDSHRQGPRASSYRLEPRAPHFSDPRVGYHHSEPRASNHRAFDTRRDFGRGAQTSSPPPSPTPLPRALPHQPLPRPTRRCLTTSITGESRNHPQIPDPVYLVSDQLDLGDVFDLDDTYVRLRDPNCLRQIYVPPRGKQGPKNRWYIVCVGREVGVFNDW